MREGRGSKRNGTSLDRAISLSPTLSLSARFLFTKDYTDIDSESDFQRRDDNFDVCNTFPYEFTRDIY